jgi:chromate transporter
MKEYLSIVWAFLNVGVFTFGGGYAMIPIVERELIKKRGWITMDEVMDYYTISQITPGLIGVNLSTFVGCKQKGALGGVLATIGFILPGATLIAAAALFLSNFAGIPAVQHAFAGIRVAVAALIVDTVIKMVKGVFKDAKAVAIYVIVFGMSVLPVQGGRLLGIAPGFLKSPVLLVLASGLAGLLVYRQSGDTAEGRQ